MLSHSQWGRSRPVNWLNSILISPSKGRGDMGRKDEGRGIAHMLFLLTCHLDLLVIADLKAQKCSLISVFTGTYSQQSPYSTAAETHWSPWAEFFCTKLSQHQALYTANGEIMIFHKPDYPLLSVEEQGICNGHIVCHILLLWRYLADVTSTGWRML